MSISEMTDEYCQQGVVVGGRPLSIQSMDLIDAPDGSMLFRIRTPALPGEVDGPPDQKVTLVLWTTSSRSLASSSYDCYLKSKEPAEDGEGLVVEFEAPAAPKESVDAPLIGDPKVRELLGWLHYHQPATTNELRKVGLKAAANQCRRANFVSYNSETEHWYLEDKGLQMLDGFRG